MEAHILKTLGHREFLDFDYALINPMQLELNQWRDLPSDPLRPDGFSASPNLLPRLVKLKVLNFDERAELLMRSERWMLATRMPLFSALLRSGQSSERLISHFSTRMSVAAPDQQKYWLRFHDPRVFSRLDGLLNDAQMRWLLGPVVSWTWYETLTSQWRSRDKPPQLKHYAPTTLDAAQWDALDRLPLLNRCLKQWARHVQVPEDYRSLAERIDGKLQEASSLGLVDREDVCLYAVSVERYGSEWTMQPSVLEAIRLAVGGEQSLVRGLADMDRPQASSTNVTNSTRYA